MKNSIRLVYAVALVGYFGLLSLTVAWNAWLSPPTVVPVSIALLALGGPLLFPLRGLLHGRPYTFAWTSLLALFYLLHGAVEVYSNPTDRWLAAAELLFASLLYVGAVMFVRASRRRG